MNLVTSCLAFCSVQSTDTKAFSVEIEKELRLKKANLISKSSSISFLYLESGKLLVLVLDSIMHLAHQGNHVEILRNT